uniref:Probable G-protein coupled receptor 34 n=1 Tax=Nothobranchius korthausae TaxID=1143690 RepID=A0A1A8G5P4_9TELE
MTIFLSTASPPTTLTSVFSKFSPSFVSATSASMWNASFTDVSPSNQTCELDGSPLRLPLAAFYSFVFIFGLVGNLFALWVFLSLHSRRNSVRVFLINCAMADLILLACLPFRVFYHLNKDNWVLGPVTCKLVGTTFYMNMYISIVLLGFISLDRYLRMRGKGRERRGMRLRLLGRRQPWSWVACGALWAASLTVALALIATPNKEAFSGKCFQYKKKTNWEAYFNLMVVLLFWFVFILLVVSYVKIASKLLYLSKNKPDFPNAQKYKQTAKKSFFVLFLFTICFVPYHAFRPFYILTQLDYFKSCSTLRIVDHTNEIMLLFSAFNSCLDPVMYFLLSGSVRKTALRVLGHRLGTRLPFLNDATSNSSTIDNRRPSVPLALPAQVLHNPSLTPSTSFSVVNSNLHRAGMTTLQSTAQQ